ncbi:MAG: sulfatase-like hydrolase/transferase [Planctomycetaceae bacterium]
MKSLWMLLTLLTLAPSLLVAAERPPNVILILADDLGAQELSCYGSQEHSTPHLDQMAAEGVRFETFFAMPLCTPTRVCLMTGRYGFRSGYLGMANQAFIPLKDSPQRDIANHFTLADLVKTRGYATAQVGKWQLSGELPTLVRDCGFDEYCMWAYDHNLPAGVTHPAHERRGGATCRYWHPSLIQNGEYRPTEPNDYGPDIFNEFAIDFARRHKDEPFFIYYTSVLTHGPQLETPDPEHPGERWPAGFKSCLEYLDVLMGRLNAGLKEAGLDQNTYVMFVGDNGTGGDGKGTVTELGARVPCIITGPGIEKGLVSRAVGDLTDFIPTLAAISGAKLPQDVVFDGHSLLPVLQGKQERHRDWIYSHLDDGRVLRDERWLLELAKGGQGERFFDCGTSRDGTGYKDVTDSQDPEVKAARAKFAEILSKIPEPKPHPGMGAGDGNAKAKSSGKGKKKPDDPNLARFEMRDRNHDGIIDRQEFFETMSSKTQAAGEARLKKLDTNRDGQVSREEFISNSQK